MSQRLEEQIRRYTEHMDAVAPPVEALLPPDLRDETGRTRIGTVTVTIPVRPGSAHGLPGWVFALAGAAAVLLVSIPILLWVGSDGPEIADTTATTVITPTTVPNAPPAEIAPYPVVFNGNEGRLSGTGWEPGLEVVATLELDTGIETRSAIADADGHFSMAPFDECCSDRTVLTVTQGDRSVVSRIDRGIVIDLVDTERELVTIVYGNALDVTLVIDGSGGAFTTTFTPDSDWWSIDLSESVDITEGATVTASIERSGVAFTHTAQAGERHVETGMNLTRQQLEGRGFSPNTPLDLTINGTGLPGGLVTDNGGHFLIELVPLGVRVEPGDALRLEDPVGVIETVIPELSFDQLDPNSGVARGRAAGVDALSEVAIRVLESGSNSTRVDVVRDVPVQGGSWTVQLPPLAGGDSVTDGWVAVHDSSWYVRRDLDTSTGRPALPLVGLDLPGGDLHGSGFPVESPVLVSIDGGSTWDGAGRTSVDGRFELPGYFTGPAGTELIVEIGGVTASTVLPEVSITDVDTVLDTVTGMIDLTPTANCCINVFVFSDARDSEAEQFPLTIRDDGTWSADLGDRFDLTLSSRVGVDYQDPNGISIQWDVDALTSG